jgi:hypothetical protein
MWSTRGTASLAVVLCLLLMQAQLFAASTLGCRHLIEGAPVTAACAYHSGKTQAPGEAAEATVLDCQKCALHCAIGACAKPSAAAVAEVRRSQPDPEPHPGRHFYRYAPEAAFRPPIRHLS